MLLVYQSSNVHRGVTSVSGVATDGVTHFVLKNLTTFFSHRPLQSDKKWWPFLAVVSSQFPSSNVVCPVFFLNPAHKFFFTRVLSPAGWCHPGRSTPLPAPLDMPLSVRSFVDFLAVLSIWGDRSISGLTTDACKEKVPSFILMQASLILRPKVRHKSNFDIRWTLNVTRC